MLKITKHSIFFGLFFFALLFNANHAFASESFDPNYIISDEEIFNSNAMTEAQIQDFLDRKGGYLANYSCENPDGVSMKASKIIYDRAVTNKISPKFILVLLQKEMSLIDETSPTQRQLDWATGYGCPDGGGCNDRWRGFWKQVNSATMQFYSYMTEPHLYKYKVGETYIFTNPYSTIKNETNTVIPQNQATAALYNYTPHVYNGNYNFYKIWQRFFTRTYPDGSLLQARGEAGVWLIQFGQKRPFLSQGALTSRFDKDKIIQVEKSDLDNYPKGAPIKFPNYSLIRSPRGTIYLLVDEKKRRIASMETFRSIGYNPEEVMNSSWEDINSYTEGQPLNASSTYPTGALLQDKTSGGVYWVDEGEKAPLIDAVFLKTKFKNKKIIQVSPEELNNYTTTNPIKFGDGEILKSSASPAVYLITEGKKHTFLSGDDFVNLGYKWENIITVSPQVLALYSIGDPVKNE